MGLLFVMMNDIEVEPLLDGDSVRQPYCVNCQRNKKRRVLSASLSSASGCPAGCLLEPLHHVDGHETLLVESSLQHFERFLMK